MWFQSEEVQAESLTSITVVNQVAALHYLQQHDNPFNTWHTPGNKRLHPSASCWHVVKDPSLTFYEMSILSARTHATFKSACRAKAGRMQVFVFMWERARAPPPLPSAARRGETHTNTHNHTWQGEKLQCGAWRINCRIKVLMGNKREKQLFITLAQDQTHTLLKCPPWVIVQRGSGGSSTDNAALPELIRAGWGTHPLKRWRASLHPSQRWSGRKPLICI